MGQRDSLENGAAVQALMIGTDGTLGLGNLPEPKGVPGSLLVEGVAVGVCGTDRWLRSRGASVVPFGSDHLVVGHESLGRVLEAPGGSGFCAGELVVGIVRSPDPVPCRRCLAGDYDLCENDRYQERGIRGRDGFAAERYLLEPSEAVRIDPSLGLLGVLIEPTSVVVKAWEQIDRVTRQAPERALVLGAGPIGLLAALTSVRRGCQVAVVDKVERGPKPEQVEALGASYSTTTKLPSVFDVVFECSGVLGAQAVELAAPAAVICLIGEGGPDPRRGRGFSAITRELIWHNKTVVGTISSARRHYELASELLAGSDRHWLEFLLGPKAPVEDWGLGFDAAPEAIKAVITFAELLPAGVIRSAAGAKES